MGIMRGLLPPQRDNERALKYLEEKLNGVFALKGQWTNIVKY